MTLSTGTNSETFHRFVVRRMRTQRRLVIGFAAFAAVLSCAFCWEVLRQPQYQHNRAMWLLSTIPVAAFMSYCWFFLVWDRMAIVGKDPYSIWIEPLMVARVRLCFHFLGVMLGIRAIWVLWQHPYHLWIEGLLMIAGFVGSRVLLSMTRRLGTRIVLDPNAPVVESIGYEGELSLLSIALLMPKDFNSFRRVRQSERGRG